MARERDWRAHPDDFNQFGFPILLTVDEAAALLGIDAAGVRGLLATHRVPVSKFGAGDHYDRPTVRALRDVLRAAGKLEARS